MKHSELIKEKLKRIVIAKEYYGDVLGDTLYLVIDSSTHRHEGYVKFYTLALKKAVELGATKVNVHDKHLRNTYQDEISFVLDDRWRDGRYRFVPFNQFKTRRLSRK